jgi:hypothetical protein
VLDFAGAAAAFKSPHHATTVGGALKEAVIQGDGGSAFHRSVVRQKGQACPGSGLLDKRESASKEAWMRDGWWELKVTMEPFTSWKIPTRLSEALGSASLGKNEGSIELLVCCDSGINVKVKRWQGQPGAALEKGAFTSEFVFGQAAAALDDARQFFVVKLALVVFMMTVSRACRQGKEQPPLVIRESAHVDGRAAKGCS